MTAILVIEDHELKLIRKALESYKKTLNYLNYENEPIDEYEKTKNVIDKLNKTVLKQRKSGVEL